MDVHFEGLSKSYPPKFRLHIDGLAIPSGERVGLVGNNGAGKTTLLLLLLGLECPDGGVIRLGGASVAERRSWQYRVASYLDESSLFPFLTPMEYWTFVGEAYGLRPDEIERRLSEFDGFIDLSDAVMSGRYVREFSLGSRKKIGLVAAMLVRPDLLLLDEPSNSLDPRSQAELKELLWSINVRHGTTVIFSSHNLHHVSEFCSRILMIDDGVLVHDGTADAESMQFVEDFLTKRAPVPGRS